MKIIRPSQLLIDFPEIEELDMNPVLIKDGKPLAVDARILVLPVDTPSSLHLVISPYPEETKGIRFFSFNKGTLAAPYSRKPKSKLLQFSNINK